MSKLNEKKNTYTAKNSIEICHGVLVAPHKTILQKTREILAVLVCFATMAICLCGPWVFPKIILVLSMIFAALGLVTNVSGARRYVVSVLGFYGVLLVAASMHPDLHSALRSPESISDWCWLLVMTYISAVRTIEAWGYPLHRYFQHLGILTNHFWLFRFSQRAHQAHHRVQDSIANYFRDLPERMNRFATLVVSRIKGNKTANKQAKEQHDLNISEQVGQKKMPSLAQSPKGYPDSLSLSWLLPSLVFILPHCLAHTLYVKSDSLLAYLVMFYGFLIGYTIIAADYAHRAQHHYSTHWWDNLPWLQWLWGPYFHWTKLMHLVHHESEDYYNYGISTFAADVIAGSLEQDQASQYYEIIRRSQLSGDLYLRISTEYEKILSNWPDNQAKLKTVVEQACEFKANQNTEKQVFRKQWEQMIERSNIRMQATFFQAVPDLELQKYLWQTETFPNKTLHYVRAFNAVVCQILAHRCDLKLNDAQICRYQRFQELSGHLMQAAKQILAMKKSSKKAIC